MKSCAQQLNGDYTLFLDAAGKKNDLRSRMAGICDIFIVNLKRLIAVRIGRNPRVAENKCWGYSYFINGCFLAGVWGRSFHRHFSIILYKT